MTLLIRRRDNGETSEVAAREIRYGLPLATFHTLAWGQTVDAEHARSGDVPYIRQTPDSRMCVRVDVLPTLVQGFKHFLTVPCLEGLQGEVARTAALVWRKRAPKKLRKTVLRTRKGRRPLADVSERPDLPAGSVEEKPHRPRVFEGVLDQDRIASVPSCGINRLHRLEPLPVSVEAGGGA